MIEFSVIMPTFEQVAFVGRALDSLLAQTCTAWELILVDDGSSDGTQDAVRRYLSDPRVQYLRLERNRGLGAALNAGLDRACGRFLAYLPSDDVYYPEHLASLAASLDGDPAAVGACAGVRHHYNRTARGRIPGHPLQLVQVAHRPTPLRWIERDELVTDDLDRMFWTALAARGPIVDTGLITAEWVDHPAQRHKVLQEPVGGINLYRQRYRVAEPLRFHTTVGNAIDEVALYREARGRADTPAAADGLKILLVGELAYNADRVLALEERGHRLYGLWMREPYWYNTVGPVPFGHVRDVPYDGWQDAVRELQPDIIYALLNWQAVPFARHVLDATRGQVPFVWHFKEGPFICLEKGTWPDLAALYAGADGLVYSSPEMRDWFGTAVPAAADRPSLALDGDLPKREWFSGTPSPRLSRHGEIHTVVPGRPIGLHPETVRDLAAEGVHLHFYGDFTQGQWRAWIERARGMAGRFLHLHNNVDQARWVAEFSQYDAGWLHFFQSENEGDIRRANWDDLNYPARLATLIAGGLPVLQRDNRGSIVATQRLARELDIGVFFTDMRELASQLRDERLMARVRDHVRAARDQFTFDAHADELLAFFRDVIASYRVDARSISSDAAETTSSTLTAFRQASSNGHAS